MFQTSYAPRRRVALLGATALVAGLAGSAYAQSTNSAGAAPGATTPCSADNETNCTRSGATPLASPQGATPAVPEATEQVEVTGTRIQNSNANSQNPITVITSKEIAQSQAETIEDVLKKIPSIGSSGIGSTTNNGGDGADCTDIRNLGFVETLVLVDGKRFTQSSSEGFSCVDLNNIPLQMIDHIDVLKDGASTTYGADAVSGVINIVLKKHYSGTSVTLDGELPTRRGGSSGDLTVTTGQSYDKGNFILGFDYFNRGGIVQGDRSWARNIDADKTGVKTPNGSGFVPYGQLFPYSGGDFLAHADGSLTPFTAADKFDFAPFQYLNSALEKESVTASTSYDFNEYMTGYLQAFYTHKLTTERLAPSPILLTIPTGTPFNNTGGTNYLYQRALEFGDRIYQQSNDTFQTNVGIRGTLPYDVNYDTYYQYGRSSNLLENKNSVNLQTLENAIAAGANPYSPDQTTVDAAKITAKNNSLYNLRIYGIDVSKKDLAALPFGELGLALGFNHRAESGSFQPDNLVSLGITPANAAQPTAGGFDVNEVYAEASIPILKDLPFAKDVSLDLGGRYFSYNTFGSGTIWKISGNWTPIDDIRFRGNLGTAFRQPSINEAFGGQDQSQLDAFDPCVTANQSSLGLSKQQLATVAANCARQGLPANLTQVNTQINTITGGNPALQPERARTEGAGVVVKPRFVPNLAVTADYFRTKIQSTITTLDSQTILNGCYTSTDLSSSLCNDITRRGNGLINSILEIDQNVGVTKTSGMDFGITYNVPLGRFGAVSLNNQAEWIFNYLLQNDPGTPGFSELNGTINDGSTGFAYPRVKDNNSITWSDGALSLDYTTRFISGMDFQIHDTGVNRVTKVADVFYHDIEATYVYKNITFTTGIDNILDLPAPFVPDQATNTDPQIYDVTGRTVYLKTSFSF